MKRLINSSVESTNPNIGRWIFNSQQVILKEINELKKLQRDTRTYDEIASLKSAVADLQSAVDKLDIFHH